MAEQRSDRQQPPPKPMPAVTEETRPFWEGARAGRLMLPHCSACGAWVFYPRPFCTACGAEALVWEQASGEGTVYSYTVCHRPAGPAFADDVPYVVALIDLREGPRMLSTIRTDEPAAVRIGAPVRAQFEPMDEAIALPVFVLAG